MGNVVYLNNMLSRFKDFIGTQKEINNGIYFLSVFIEI